MNPVHDNVEAGNVQPSPDILLPADISITNTAITALLEAYDRSLLDPSFLWSQPDQDKLYLILSLTFDMARVNKNHPSAFDVIHQMYHQANLIRETSPIINRLLDVDNLEMHNHGNVAVAMRLAKTRDPRLAIFTYEYFNRGNPQSV